MNSQHSDIQIVVSKVIEFARQDPAFLADLTRIAESQRTSPQDVHSPSTEERTSSTGLDDEECRLTILRCHLKAEAARWAIERVRLKADGADHSLEIAPMDRQILEKANTIAECSLWMNRADFQVPADDELLMAVAGCFEATAVALSVSSTAFDLVRKRQALIHQSLRLVAEAQSALRQSVTTVQDRPDPDQVAAYLWVLGHAGELRLFVDQFMREDDPADPNKWRDIIAKAEALESLIRSEAKTLRRQRKLLNKTSYLIDILSEDDDSTADDLERVANVVDELVDSGLHPSDPSLRNLLLPRLDEFSMLDELPKGFEQAIRYAEVRHAVPSSEFTFANAEHSGDVKKVAKLLKGKTVALLGGEPRKYTKEALTKAFKLKELLWTKGEAAVSSLATVIGKPDVAVVLLAIRWSPHAFGDAKNICDRYQKPLVWLPNGMGVNQVAHQILTQCAERLKTASSHGD